MLPLEDLIDTVYKTASRIKKIASGHEIMMFVCFVDKASFKSPPANETLASKCSWKRQNIDYFIGFIDSCDGETKPMNLMKIRQMHELGGDELLLILGRF